MVNDTRSLSRTEINDTIDQHDQDLDEKENKLEVTAKDLETIRVLMDQLDTDSFTTEGRDSVEDSVDASEEIAEQVFDEDEAALTDVQGESEDFKAEIEELSESSERNLGRISDVTAPIETKEVIDQVRDVKEAVLEDLDAIKGFINRIENRLGQDKEVQGDLRRVREGARR